jgi:hypothetical protein
MSIVFPYRKSINRVNSYYREHLDGFNNDLVKKWHYTPYGEMYVSYVEQMSDRWYITSGLVRGRIITSKWEQMHNSSAFIIEEAQQKLDSYLIDNGATLVSEDDANKYRMLL